MISGILFTTALIVLVCVALILAVTLAVGIFTNFGRKFDIIFPTSERLCYILCIVSLLFGFLSAMLRGT